MNFQFIKIGNIKGTALVPEVFLEQRESCEAVKTTGSCEAVRREKSLVTCMEVRFTSKVTRGFSLFASSRLIFTTLRLSHGSRKTSGTRVKRPQCSAKHLMKGLWQFIGVTRNDLMLVSSWHLFPFSAPLTKQLGSPRKLEFPKDVGKLTSTPMSGSESHVTRNVSVVRSYLLEPPKTAPLDAATLPTSKHITKWTVSDVADYIKSTDCHRFAENFMKQVSLRISCKFRESQW